MKQGAPEPIAALNRVRVVPQADQLPMVDIREACPGIRLSRETVVPYLRPTVARMVAKAMEALPDNVFLSVGEAWRPLCRQIRIYDRYFNQLRENHPNWTSATLRRQTNRYFAPYNQKAPPGHCTGGAVDVALVNALGEPLDLTSPFERWAAAATFQEGLTQHAQHNRMVMVEAMLGAGFSNCRDEFWHYSYGDAAWAVRTGATVCFYDLVELPEELWIEQERLAELG